MAADKPDNVPVKRKKAGGRQKGTPNKITKTIREAILESFENLGGSEYLERMARIEPVAYMTLLGKVLPTQLTGLEDEPLLPDGFTVKVVGSGSGKKKT
jgi:hypothetical protein